MALNERPSDRRSPLRSILVLGIAAGAFALAAWFAFFAGPDWRRRHADGGPAPSGLPEPADLSPAALAPVAASPYLNTRGEAHYVGTQQCIECHADEHAGYRHTGHSRSLSRVDPAEEPPDGRFDHPLSGLTYEAHRRDGKLWHRESLLVPGGEPLELADRPLEYGIGSGRFARTYVAQIDDFLVQSPLTWYGAEDAWRMSPGYDLPSHLSFQRNMNRDCLFCHAGQADNVPGRFSRFEFEELAIGCERCHGPGSLHVARHRDANAQREPAGDLTIVNPRKLPRELGEAVCQQCHLETAASATLQGRSRHDFRPGLKWNDFCMNYDFESPAAQMTVTGHVQQMHHSRCYQASETLTCISCHDLHAPPPPELRVEHYRAACLACHQDESCRLAPAVRHERRENNCAACHMPQSPTDVAHVAFTHHRIGIHPEQPPPASDPYAAAPLAPVLDDSHVPPAHRRRALGLAYLQRYVGYGSDSRLLSYRQQAEELLLEAQRHGLEDAEVLAALAVIAGGRGDLTATRRYAEAALARDDIEIGDRLTCFSLLANVHVRQGRPDEAQPLLRVLADARLDPSDWILIGRAHERSGQLPQAIAALARVAEIEPKMPETHEILAELYQRQGNVELQRQSLQRARLLRTARRLEPGPDEPALGRQR